MQKKTEKKLLLGGKEIKVEISDLVPQANIAVMVTCGETVVLVTAVSTKEREDLDYFPLQVEYVEKLYAGGRIKGSRWVKREGKPTDEAILTARMVDRFTRPLFPEGFRNETQLALIPLSIDQENDPDVLAALAASVALHVSDIPWNGPVGIVRVGRDKEGKFLINPVNGEKEDSDLDLIVATGKDGVVMLEGGADQIPEEEFLKAIELGKKEGDKIVEFIDQMRKEVGAKKTTFSLPDPKLVKQIEDSAKGDVSNLMKGFGNKKSSEKLDGLFDALDAIVEKVKESTENIGSSLIKEVVNKMFKKQLRKQILEGKRPDGRKLDEIRPLSAKVGILPRTHGSASFKRGETQALTITTLGSPSLKQLIETAEGEESKRYIHHYIMPPYSMGLTGRFGSPNRREIGHGALAEKALIPVLPSEKDFPYTIRVVSEILSSNGSTSMASTCGSTLSLMDAGVPITDIVAGIGVGLVTKGKEYVLLTDIRGIEDFYGDMDFKIMGTEKGITGVQVDIKINGLSLSLIKEIVARSRKGRLEVLAVMKKAIDKPRKELSRYAPKVKTLEIPTDTIGALIGPGGKNIRQLMQDFDCEIDVDDDGLVTVTGDDSQKIKGVVERIEALTYVPQVGDEFTGPITRMEPFGVFVEILPGKEGLVHVSKIGTGFISNPADVLKMGQTVKVKLYEIDEKGRINLAIVEPKIVGKARSFPDKSFNDRPNFDKRRNRDRPNHKDRF